VQVIIKNRIYLGEARHGEYVNLRAHSALIAPGLWRAAQNPPGGMTPRGGYLLTSLVRCGTCGRRLSGKRMGTRRTPIYACSHLDCGYKVSIKLASLDSEILRQCADRISLCAEPVPRADGTAELDAQIKRVTARINNLMTLVPMSRVGITSHQEKLANLEAKLEALEQVRDRLIGPSTRSLLDGLPDSVRTAAVDERFDSLARLPLDTRREILRTWIERIEVAGTRVLGRSIATADRVSVLWKL
jgi:hypothetical protein